MINSKLLELEVVRCGNDSTIFKIKSEKIVGFLFSKKTVIEYRQGIWRDAFINDLSTGEAMSDVWNQVKGIIGIGCVKWDHIKGPLKYKGDK